MSNDDYRELVPRDPRMHTEAACIGADVNLFFPPLGGSVAEAKRICSGCPVRDACLEYALANNQWRGVWGGKSGKERRAMKREMAA